MVCLWESALQAWTYSHLDKFDTCPKQYYHTSVARDYISPPTEATIWGERVHTAFENRIKVGTPLPEGMTQWESIALKIERLPGEKLPEQKFAIDKNFKPADWKASWSRGIADLVVVHEDKAVVLDYKTGKRKLTDQLALYAAFAFAHYPEVKLVTTGFVWLKDRKIDREPFKREELPIVWQKLLPRVKKLESAFERESWPAKPSGLCNGWCPVKCCPHYKERR